MIGCDCIIAGISFAWFVANSSQVDSSKDCDLSTNVKFNLWSKNEVYFEHMNS